MSDQPYDFITSVLELVFVGLLGAMWGFILGLVVMPDGRKLVKEALRFPITKLEEWVKRQEKGDR